MCPRPPNESDSNVYKLTDKAEHDPRPEETYKTALVWECICDSRRFYLTPEGPECVYCGKLAVEWMKDG
jgi:hypothetical protein